VDAEIGLEGTWPANIKMAIYKPRREPGIDSSL
jgi:hypothetical protein